MKRSIPTPLVALLFTFFAVGLPSVVTAQPVGLVLAEVTNVRQQVVQGWLEFEVELNVAPPQPSLRFVDRIKVELNIGFDGPEIEGQKTFVMYRSEAEAVTIERGRAFFRFYLPPEVVRRDTLREANYFAVTVNAGGQEQVASRGSFSSRTLTTPAILQNFKSRVMAEAGVNEGILQPQYLTPFAFSNAKPAPSFLRREVR